MNNMLRTFALALTVAASTHVSADDNVDELKNSLAKRLPQYEVSRIDSTPIEGLYQVILSGQVIYMTKDARYMLDGNLVDLSTRKNYSEDAMSEIRLSELEDLGEENMVVYTPEKVKHTITVVTDIDCPYCRRLHSEMDQYLDGGIKVRYVFMPLKGKRDYQTTVTVWCSKDKNEALDLAKGGTEDPRPLQLLHHPVGHVLHLREQL